MAAIVVVHGVGKQYLGPRSLHGGIADALLDGVGLATARDRGAGAGPRLRAEDVEVAFYGHLFRPPGTKGEPAYTYRDVGEPEEAALLYAWWREAARLEPGTVPPPDAEAVKAPVPRTVQRALYALSRSRFLAGTADRFLIGVLKQVRAYLTDPEVRRRVLDEVAVAVAADTRVIVGHSLGSVVAYEALCAHPRWPVTDFVTIGSPLGIPNLVFDRLRPPPEDGRGQWPGRVARWTNLCDSHDVVALAKRLRPLFGQSPLPGQEPPAGRTQAPPVKRVEDVLVDNGWRAHAIEPHLTAAETGAAIARALRGPDAP
ncbi:GPI inositol-deacylase [Streptomyces sp. HPF1205]|uniref:GPI inositol-deacylase n=1 Tax=Streptomyces sp. HPF1205 TaxID=2873262 RepID=UPI001CECA4D0|nr:GPI inositol-deacylase [Streptomyces sp. HPF1205]